MHGTSDKPSSDAAAPVSIVERSTVIHSLSIIVPVYNEAESIPHLLPALTAVLDPLPYDYEIICVDDGSSDGSLAALEAATATVPKLRVISFMRNSGQTAAMQAGIDMSSNDVIIPIDADLQNDPQDIPRLIEKLNDGYDVVSGWRADRKDHKVKRNFVSSVANVLISRVSGVRLHDYGCSLKAYRRDVIEDVRLYGEMHRFIPIYCHWEGGKVTEIPVAHHARIYGKSKYGMSRVLKVLLDLVVVRFLHSTLTKPSRWFGGVGIAFMALSLLAGSIAILLKMSGHADFVQTPLPLLAVIGFMMGVMSILMGLQSELLMRTYFESQQKRTYRVRKSINCASSPPKLASGEVRG